MRWAVRLTGLASTIILARLLSPADYGVVAIATLILGTIEILGEAGQGNAIIRHPDPTPAHYNAAWTISLMFGFGLALIVLAATPLTVIYFHEPRAKLVLEVLAIRTALSGLQNVGTVNFQRNLQFHKQFQLAFYGTAVQFVVVVAGGLLLRNYWALVIAILAKQASTVVLSYMMEPYRPRVSFAKIPEIFSFSFWNLFRNIGSYAQHQVGKIAIGGYAGAAAMGQYEVGRDLAASPIGETCGPILYALYPVIARVQHDQGKRRELFLSVLYWSAVICSSMAIGIAVVADDLVDLLLGPHWAAVKPLVPWFAFYYGVNGVTGSSYIALESVGLAGASARLQWLRVIGLVALVFPTAFYFRTLEPVAIANFAGAMVISPTLFLALSKSLKIPLRDFARVLWRPLFSGVAMAAVLLLVNRVLPISGSLRLLLDATLGAIVFVATLMALWFAIGRPYGPEHSVWQRAGEVFTVMAGALHYRFSRQLADEADLVARDPPEGQARTAQDVIESGKASA